MISGSQDNRLEFWDMTQYGARTHPTESLSDWVRAVAYSPNGYYFASGLQDGEINIWEGISNYPVRNLTGHTQSIRSLDFHPTQPILASASASLSGPGFRAFNLDSLPASIGATGRTNMVRQFGTVALRAIVQGRKRQPKMATPLTLTCLSVFPLW